MSITEQKYLARTVIVKLLLAWYDKQTSENQRRWVETAARIMCQRLSLKEMKKWQANLEKY